MGSGGILCEKFVASARSADARSMEVTQWLLGYVSGLNMFWKAANGTDRFINVETERIPIYVLRYCEANPQKTALNGVND
jgi:hypothetical protein